MLTDLTSEVTLLTWTIRLSKVKQLAFSFISLFCDVPLILSSLVNLLNLHPYSEAVPNHQKRSFTTGAQAADAQATCRRSQAGPCFTGVVFLLLMVRW